MFPPLPLIGMEDDIDVVNPVPVQPSVVFSVAKVPEPRGRPS